jgi:hypothetical protein
MTAFEGPLKKRLCPLLPATHADIKRKSMFEKQELTTWSFGATESSLSHSKQMKRGEYEQGRKN